MPARWAQDVHNQAKVAAGEDRLPLAGFSHPRRFRLSAVLWRILGVLLMAMGFASQASADWCFGIFDSIARDTKRRQCWPEPFVAPDRGAVRAPFCTMVSNGWRRQNMLGEFHFEPGTGKLTEAGQMKVRWIVTAAPQQHRFIYVHTGMSREETAARSAAVHELTMQIAPENMPPILTTSIPDDGWPADQVDLIGRKFQATTPPPRLPARANADGGAAVN